MKCIFNLPHGESCERYDCDRCLGESFASHHDQSKLAAWDYEKNELKPINYMRGSNSVIYLICGLCSKSFRMTVISASTRDIICQNCMFDLHHKKQKEHKKNIKENKNIMSSKQFKCENCNKSFQFKHQLKRHEKSSKHIAVVDGSAYQCDEKDCDYETNIKMNLTLHILNNHSTLEERKKGFSYYCEVCDIGKATEKEIDIHLKTNKHGKMLKK
jgi:hypothetical protein